MTNDITKSNKVWICLYTCCVVRAIHLDIVPDMSTQTFIRSFKRFTARRGLPRKVISDNGKTFKAAAKMIESVMRHEDVQHYMYGVGVEWLFNIERMTNGKATFSYDELLTTITEVEMIVNSRPICLLTIWKNLLHISPPNWKKSTDDIEITPTRLGRRMKYLNNTLNQFWRRWRNEYLLELRDCHHYDKGKSNVVLIAICDVVVVHSEERPRGFWKLARVEDTIIGRDGQIRGAVVRLHAKGNRTSILQRPIQRLYPLEINCHIEDSKEDEYETTEESGYIEGKGPC